MHEGCERANQHAPTEAVCEQHVLEVSLAGRARMLAEQPIDE